jgi:hypothetical protein
VSLSFASWNQFGAWLQALDRLWAAVVAFGSERHPESANSRTRAVLEYAATPYIPAAARTFAVSPNTPSTVAVERPRDVAVATT